MAKTISPFDFRTASHVRFGRGTRDGAVQIVQQYGQSVLLIRGRSVSWVDRFSAQLSAHGSRVHEVVCYSEPDLAMLEQALEHARRLGIDVVVSVGGGAVIDMGKAIAALAPSMSPTLAHLEGVGQGIALSAHPLPFVALPSTSGTGAEVTKNAVILVPKAGRKVSLRDDRMLPDVAIIDPALTDDAPRAVTLASGLDALTQVIEPYLCTRANPLIDALCREAIPKAVAALAKLEQGEDPAARDDMAFVSLAGGMALANAGLGAVHGLAGVIGGRLHAPHGLICGRLLGPVLAANHAALGAGKQDTTRFEDVARWLSLGFGLPEKMAFAGLTGLLDQWQVARLGAWITPSTDLEKIAREAASSSSMRANPCTLSPEALVGIMQDAL